MSSPFLSPLYPAIVSVDLIDRLSSVDNPQQWPPRSNFLRALKELMNACEFLVEHQFRRQSRKVITLTKIARDSLNRAGISLYSFTYCPQWALQHKTLYFELLHIIQQRRKCFDSAVHVQVSRLLLPLSPSFEVRNNAHSPNAPAISASSQWIHQRKVSYSIQKTYRKTTSSFSTPNTDRQPLHYSMPPPGAFPPLSPSKKLRLHRRKCILPKRLWSEIELEGHRPLGILPSSCRENKPEPEGSSMSFRKARFGSILYRHSGLNSRHGIGVGRAQF